MQNFILNCYKEYKLFMNIKEGVLPQIFPITHEQEHSLAHICEDDIGTEPMNIYYKDELFKYNETYIKSILFHEFTHIYDGISLKSKVNDIQFSTFMALYSEYHASQIELLCNLGYKNIKSIKKIDLSQVVLSYENEKIDINSYLAIPMSNASLIIDKPSDAYYNLPCDEYFAKYKEFEVKTMYYLGKKNICFTVSTTPRADITKKIYQNFYPYISNIETDILNKNINLLCVHRKQLWENFISIYPLNENEKKLLLKILSDL